MANTWNILFVSNYCCDWIARRGFIIENNFISTFGSFVFTCTAVYNSDCDLFSSWKIADIFEWYCNLVNGTFVIILRWINLHLTRPNTSIWGKDWFGPLSTIIITHQIVKSFYSGPKKSFRFWFFRSYSPVTWPAPRFSPHSATPVIC